MLLGKIEYVVKLWKTNCEPERTISFQIFFTGWKHYKTLKFLTKSSMQLWLSIALLCKIYWLAEAYFHYRAEGKKC